MTETRSDLKSLTVGQEELALEGKDSTSISPSISSYLQPRTTVDQHFATDPPASPGLTQRLFKKRHVHKWKSPLLMVGFFTLGLAFSLAHCIFYPKLKDNVVGNSDSQEEKLRFGTAFAFLAQITLGASVWTTYTQWLWRTVRHKDMTVDVLNAAFGADTSVLFLLNFAMLEKLRLGSLMALFAWGLLLPPFFTPATLFVYLSTSSVEINELRPYPNIANGSVGHKYSYSPPTHRNTTQFFDDEARTFTGPRTQLNLVSTATASLGEILSVDSPYNSTNYRINFFAPIINCQEANSTMAALIYDYLLKEMASTSENSVNNETDNAYYAFVPTYNTDGDLVPASTPRSQSPSNALNQLWMTFLRPTVNMNSKGFHVKERHYQICTLHNASYHLEVTRDHGFQNITGSYDVLEEVAFPKDGPKDVSNMAQHAYSAFMWVICDQLVGKFAWFERANQSDPTQASQFGVIDSPIQRTSLLGSVDLDAFFDFDEEKGLYKTADMGLSDQRLQDKALAQNRTLDVLIEELSFNTTVSLMHNPLLTDDEMTQVLRTDDVNRYNYKPFGLFIPYALANLGTLITVLIGIYSCKNDEVMPDKKFQDIVSAAEDPNIIQIVRLRKRSVTAVYVDGKMMLRAGPERAQKEALKKVKAFLERTHLRKKNKRSKSEKEQA